MDKETMTRIGGNEAAFRKVNEALRGAKGLAEAGKRFPFRCECGVLGCNVLIDMSLPEYEAVRSMPTRFFLVDGHEIPETERVVQRHERFTVVEKHSQAAQVARETDPRS